MALQAVNVLILIWILGRFFFRPVANLVAKRREEATKLLADADAARKEAEGLRAEAATLRAGVDAQRDRLLADARKTAEAEKASSLAQLSNELDQRRKDAAVAIEKDRIAMQGAVLDRASELSVQIARRLLERLPTSAAFSAFLKGLSVELGKLSAETHNRLAAPDPDHPLDVVAAAKLNDEQAASLREAIHAALGSEPPIRLSYDSSLIAGFEIRGRNVIVRNNWQADLAVIRKELDR
ncbi:MAG: F0F1 ATP synthase subunit delta [Bradyrhizobium sp.]|nr:F0F1 ATP synthase subunit delta [Bradyrhizobium sp.]